MAVASLPAWWQQFGNLVDSYAQEYNLDPALVAAVIQQESGGNPNAVSSAGAVGLMQVVGGSTDPATNIQQGVSILARDVEQFGLVLGLAAYNAGPGNVQRYGQNITNPLYLIQQGWSSSDAYQVFHYITNVPALLAQFQQLLAGKQPSPSPNPTANPSPPPIGPNPSPTPAPVPTGSYGFDLALPVIGTQHIDLTGIVSPFVQIGQSLGQLPGTLTNIVTSVERFGWIVLGIAIALVGIWLLAQSEPEEVREVS